MRYSAAMRGIEVLITIHRDDGSRDALTRWTHPDGKGQWSSATNLGKDYAEHSGQEAAATYMAGWLRSAAGKVSEAHVVALVPKPAPAPEAASADGLEDLLG